MMLRDYSIHWLPLLPGWLILLLGVGLLALLAHGCRVLIEKQVPMTWVKRFGALRVAIVLLFLLCLLQPVVSFPYNAEHRPTLLVLLDTSRSMSLPAAPSGATNEESRLDQVRALLADRGKAADLERRFDLHWFTFDRTAHALDRVDLPKIQALGDATHLADSLEAAWLQARPLATLDHAGAAMPARVLLVSDGNDMGTRDVVEVARQHGLRIDTLAPLPGAERQATPKLAIAQVQCAPRTLLGSETQFRVLLHAEPAVDGPVTVKLTEDGVEILSRSVSFARGQSDLRVDFAHRPLSAGVKKYRVQASARDLPEPEPYQVSVQVLDNKHQVLILEDSWRWEFKFLRRVLEDDPSFSYTAMLARGKGAFVHFGEPDRRVNLGGFPQGRDELAWFDTIILGDVDPRQWPRGLAPALARAITEDGKSLVVVTGPNLAHLAEVATLNTLLPVELGRVSATPLAGPIEVRLTTEGARSSLFFAPVNPQAKKDEDAASAFAQLPALDQIYPPLRKRPAATVLLEASRQANDHGNLIVMAEQTVGRGRVLFIGTDTLWKWQTQAASKELKATPYALFWQQAMRALAPPRPGGGVVNLWLQPDRSHYEAGQRVRVRAEIQSEQPIAQPLLQATVVLPDERRLPLAFAPDVGGGEGQAYRAEFEAAQPGQYRLAAALLREGKLAAEMTTVIDVEPAQAELLATNVDQANLTRIALSTGGKVVSANDPDSWPTADDSPSANIREIRTLDLWNNFSLLVLLCLLLGIDWLLRLFRGFA